MFAQLLKAPGASQVVLAANIGMESHMAKKQGMADEYVEIDRVNPDTDWEVTKKKYRYGFNVVVQSLQYPDHLTLLTTARLKLLAHIRLSKTRSTMYAKVVLWCYLAYMILYLPSLGLL